MLTVNNLLGQSTLEEAAEFLSQPEAKTFYLTLLARLRAARIRGNEEGDEANSKADGANANRKGSEDVEMDESAGVGGEESSEDEIRMVVSEKAPRKSKAKHHSTPNGTTLSSSSLLPALQSLSTIHTEHKRRLRALRLSFRLLYTLRQHLTNAGVLRPSTNNRHKSIEELEQEERVALMCACLRGRFHGGAKEGKRLVDGIRCVTQTSTD